MQLSKVQEQFKNLMLDHPDALNALDGDFASVFESGNIALPKRLAVYRNNIVGSVTDTIIATCPTLEALVGKEFLEHMARSFVLKNPPQQGCLTLYGAGFDEFIANFEPAKPMPYLSDVARLDLAMNQAYYAQDDDAFTGEDLARIAPETLGGIFLKPRDHVQLLKSDYPLDAVYEYCQQDDPQDDLDISTGGVSIMVFRQNFSAHLAVLDDGEFEMLNALKTQNLETSLEIVMTDIPDFDFQAFLQKHIALETFCVFDANV